MNKTQITNPILLYLSRHVQALLLSIGRLTRAPLTSLITFMVIGIAIALPTGLFLLLQNAQIITHNWQHSARISLYLKQDASTKQIHKTLQQLRSRPTIQSVEYISPQQGLQQLSQQGQFGDILTTLKQNPLPGVIVVTPLLQQQTPAAISQLFNRLQQLSIVAQAKLDLAWLKRLYAILQLAQRSIYLIAILLAIGILFIIGNTIHLATQRYCKEISIYQLAGATRGFIRRPFLYTGIYYGLGGSVIAWLVITLTLYWLQQPIKHLTALYHSAFQLQGLGAAASLYLLLIGSALGLVGSWVAVNSHLRTTYRGYPH